MNEPWNGGYVYQPGRTLVENLQHQLALAQAKITELEAKIEELEAECDRLHEES